MVRARVQSTPSFYLYDNIDWMNISCLDANYAAKYGQTKHSDDFWVLRHAITHSKRTRDASKARLFLVGGLFNLLADSWKYRFWSTHKPCCVQGLCDLDLMQHAMTAVSHSRWFARKNGTDHVIVASHYASRKLLSNYTAFHQLNAISFERNDIGQTYCNLASTYVGRGCPLREKKYDVSFIASMRPNRSSFTLRRRACSWLGKQDLLSVGACGYWTRGHCPILGESRLGLHVRGDTYGSQRLMDILLSNTLPVFTHEEQYTILPPFFPWKNMTMLANTTTPKAFIDSLLAIRNASSNIQRLYRQANVTAIFDWSNPMLFETYMTAFATHCKHLPSISLW